MYKTGKNLLRIRERMATSGRIPREAWDLPVWLHNKSGTDRKLGLKSRDVNSYIFLEIIRSTNLKAFWTHWRILRMALDRLSLLSSWAISVQEDPFWKKKSFTSVVLVVKKCSLLKFFCIIFTIFVLSEWTRRCNFEMAFLKVLFVRVSILVVFGYVSRCAFENVLMIQTFFREELFLRKDSFQEFIKRQKEVEMLDLGIICKLLVKDGSRLRSFVGFRLNS